jgi:dipeptidyl aminopeptidase/acylaminoacyl peptidase
VTAPSGRPLEPVVSLSIVSRGYVPLRWAPDRAELATVSAAGVTLVDAETGTVRTLGDHGDVHALAWSPDARTLALAAESSFPGVRAIAASDGAPPWSHEREPDCIDTLRWSPDGRWLAAVMLDAVVLDAATGRAHIRLAQTIDDLRWSPCSRYILVRSLSHSRHVPGQFRVHAVEDGRELHGGPLADDDYLGWTDAGAELFRDGATRLGAVSTRIVDRWRRSLTYSEDGTHVAAEGDRHTLWIETPDGIRSLDGHPRTILGLAWSSRRELATGCRDGCLRLARAEGPLERHWSAPEGERTARVAWSGDGAWLAVVTEQRVCVLPRAADNMSEGT